MFNLSLAKTIVKLDAGLCETPPVILEHPDYIDTVDGSRSLVVDQQVEAERQVRSGVAGREG